MNITVNSKALAEELRLLNHIVPDKPTVPMLGSILVHADEELQFYATDFELGFRTSCAAQIVEGGKITLPGKKLAEIVEQLPDVDVQIVSERNQVRIVAGAFKSRLQTFDAEDFPLPPQMGDAEVFSLKTSALQSLVKQVSYAISEKKKHLVNGALLSLQGTVAALIATDGFRLSIATMLREDGANTSKIIPRKALDALCVEFSDETLDFAFTDKHLFFMSGDRLLVSRMLEGKFPKYENIIPRSNPLVAVCDRQALASVFRRVGLLAGDNLAVTVDLQPDILNLQAASAETGDAFENVKVSYSGNSPLRFSVNWKFMLEFLDAATGSTITLACKDAESPILLSDGTAFINVIMLIRTNT